MRSWPFVLPATLALAPASTEAADAPTVQIALDGAADLSPVYPTVTVPANEHDFVVIFSYGDQKQHLVACNISAIDAKGSFRFSRNGGRVEAAAAADGTRFLIRQPFLTDLPVGRWSADVTVDDKPVGSAEFRVGPPATPLQLSSPIEPVGSLSKGTEWNYDFRFPAEPRPGLKLTFDGMNDADAEGWLKTTVLHRIVSLDPEGTRRDERRGSGPASSSWLVATDRGLTITKNESDGDVRLIEPPELIALQPDEHFHRSWEWHPKGNPQVAERFEMWGPLPLKTPQGERPGYVVLERVPDPDDPAKIVTSIEYRFAPGLGLVHEAVVQLIPGADAATRVELDLTAMKRGSGPEPGLRKYPEAVGPSGACVDGPLGARVVSGKIV